MAWTTDLLTQLGPGPYPAGVRALELWAQSEGVTPAENNPLASGTPWPGSVAINRTGVQRYPSMTAAVAAYTYSLTNPPYIPIGQAFRARSGLAALWQVINASPWCRGCQGGHYPVALWTAAGKPAPIAPTPVPTTPTPAPTPGPTTTGHTERLATSWSRLQDDAGSKAAALRRRMIGLRTRIREAGR